MRIYRLACLLFALLIANNLKAQHITLLQQGNPTSMRGLSIVDDNTAWISGSKGYVALTANGGKTWQWQQIKGYKKSDLRSIEAFSPKEAIVVSSGTPSFILKTIDGGTTWQQKYMNNDTAYFLDAMSFADNKHGFVLGDPVNKKFVLLETNDAGNTWHPFKHQPDALPGEAAFAASGTCLRVDSSTIQMVTGGNYSRHLVYAITNNFSPDWLYSTTGLTQGKASTGAFSFAGNKSTRVFVGGNYSKPEKTDSVASYIIYCCYANAINYPKASPSGYQSCVEFLYDNTFLSTGTPGSNISTDGGQTWTKIDNNSFNVCRKAKHGNLVLLAGDKGKIAIYKP